MLKGILSIIAALVALWGAVFLPSFFTKVDAPEAVSLPSSVENKTLPKEQPPLSPATSSPKAVTKTLPKAVPPPQKSEPINEALVPVRTAVPEAVVTPGPLRVPQEISVVPSTAHSLSADGVLSFTNAARASSSALPALARNETLDRAAQIKLDDMFGRQYFEHISPIGVGPADLAKTVGYAYVIVGENLALGNFENDEKLVDAWMNSPGHRANILNTHYREIGIAVGKGIYEGKETWLAVQSFGMPLSACPAIDMTVKTQIDANNTEIARMKGAIDAKKTEIEGTSRYDSSYNRLVDEHNALVPLYNTFVEQTRALVATYNAGVQAFNTCIAEVGGN